MLKVIRISQQDHLSLGFLRTQILSSYKANFYLQASSYWILKYESVENETLKGGKGQECWEESSLYSITPPMQLDLKKSLLGALSESSFHLFMTV